jgi:hypothetical protein
MAKVGDIVFDAAHPASLARFWAAALDGYAVAPYDDVELARLRAKGINDPEDDPSVLVEPAVPGAPRLFFTQVPEPKFVKNRVHLDLRAADIDEETARLVKLGATELARLVGWVTLADPEGNEFDVLPMQ